MRRVWTPFLVIIEGGVSLYASWCFCLSSLKAWFDLTLPAVFACFLILEGGISLNSSCLDVASMRRSCLLATSQSLPVEAMMTFCMLGTGDGLLAAAELQ